MESVPGMHLEQERVVMEGLKCVHSKAAESCYRNWEDDWTVGDIEDTDLSYKVFCNPDIRVQTFLEEGRFLAALQKDGDITLLFTVSKKQKFPLCSNINCSKQTKCICFKHYKKVLEEYEEGDDASNYYWDKRTRPTPDVIQHFLDSIPVQDQHRRHGYNCTKMEYPIKRCPVLQQKFLDRLDGIFNLPESIKPDYDEHSLCKHGDHYSPDDDHLIMLSPNLTVYTETRDRVFPIPTYGRPTCGVCICVDQADTRCHLLWNIGSGKLVDYLFLHNHLHRMVSSGIAMNATYNSRKSALSDIGLKSSLGYSTFLRAFTGYIKIVQFRKEDFLCPSCGPSPCYLVCDGKTDGPTKRKVEHLKELDRAEDDTSVLCQGSFFENRVFLFEKKERRLVCQLLTNTISYDEFLNSGDICTDNGRLIKALVERISTSWPEEDIPKTYNTFLANISKLSSVEGFMQVLSPQPLQFLQEFCSRNLDLRTAEHREKEKLMAEELPALWPNVLGILFLEKAVYLPDDVANIVSKLIYIRRNSFLSAAVRSADDYVDWENVEKEHCTMFYPNWPIWRHPKKYEERSVTDCDFCEKGFDKHNDFSFGVFSVGCLCPFNITMGFELMLCKESSHNIFRLLMCRDVDLHALKGVVFDFACGLDQYILNREPSEFEYLRLLVDGAHWQVDNRLYDLLIEIQNFYQGQKKLKRPDRSGQGGHIGCSDGFNFNLYKEFLPYKQPNSQVSLNQSVHTNMFIA